MTQWQGNPLFHKDIAAETASVRRLSVITAADLKQRSEAERRGHPALGSEATGIDAKD